jgi:predicted protein tyrosine phosphatase
LSSYLPIHIPLGLAVIQLFWSYVLPLVFTGNPLALFTSIVFKRTLDYIDEHLKRNLPVLVHCNGGRGRTGTLLTAYFMKKDSLAVNDALIKIKKFVVNLHIDQSR